MKSFLSDAVFGAGALLATMALLLLVSFGGSMLIDFLVSSLGPIAGFVVFSSIATVLVGICFAAGMRIAGIR